MQSDLREKVIQTISYPKTFDIYRSFLLSSILVPHALLQKKSVSTKEKGRGLVVFLV